MASSQNVEMEAAKFLHKLIQESKDEPAKLATKLYVILQHMKSSGKEHSMPYQVISRAMETVINQHGLDIEALKLSRLPLTGGNQIGDSASAQFPGSSHAGGVAKDSKVGLADSEVSKVEPYASNRPPIGQSSSGHDYYHGSVAHRSSQSFDHESPSSLDSRSANSQSQERQQRDGKKASAKRKRGDTSLPVEQHDNTQQLDPRNAVVNPRKGKMNKVEPLASLPVKGGEHTNFNMVPSSGQMEHFASLSGSMRPMLRTKQEGQHMIEKQLDSANISNSMLRAPNPKYPEEVEVSSASGQQQGGSLPSHDIRGGWNQNKTGVPFEKSQVPRFSSNVVSGNMMAEIPAQHSTTPSLGSSAFGKVQGGMAIASNSYPVVESGFSSPMRFSGSLEHEGGSSNMLADANKVVQSGRQSNVSEMSMLRSAVPRDTGKAPFPHAPTASGMPFKEQQLKQLRAQCLVFLAFRNGLLPKKLHLEIALGNIFPKEGGNTDGPRKELSDHKGKAQSSNEPSSSPDVMMPFGRPNTVRETDILPPVASSTGRLMEADAFPREAESLKMTEDKNSLTSDISVLAEENKHLLAARKLEAETQTQEIAASQACLTMVPQQPGSLNTRVALAVSNPVEDVENGHLQVGRANQASSVMGRSWTGIGGRSEVSRGPMLAPSLQRELVPERKDSNPSQFQNLSNSSGPGNQHADGQLSSFTLKEQWRPILGVGNDHHTTIPMKDANVMSKRVSQEQEEEDRSVSTDSPPFPKYTMSVKWLMEQQKKKHLVEQSWVQKQQKTKQRIATCFDKLKENVSSSEDISAKTKSVIELKKLQLLDLQRRLRSDFLNDFFKPITTEMDRLKSFKKHRHGRRIKQVEKFEQKMKEERQKRIRERQKEFFSEIEVHKERLDDVFKIKRERWKGFNKYVKEFHKRKERIHREKIDRIQREKINLLKINDVEGYLRMVQDAKSDRVKQLLKETEKYLQKLGSKLQEAKTTAGRFEHDMDEIGTESVIEKSETTIENEDESDQAKHYMESNEKYYLMAHSIKETIAEQPLSLQGGKLREYQMNGLRWLLSLYNNHLNGILADEMGLGKTVQVIALICYLMETKNDRGPFLVVVPSSVLPGWESEINAWAPSVHKIVYAGPPEERRRLFKEKIVSQKFNVLLTTYEYLMNKHDRPKLSKLHWHYIIIDEGHRIKNASCKLNAELKHYQSSHRLLLTGTPLQNNLEELWALLNFLLPNIFNSSEDFSQWFNKPFQSNGDNSPDEALLSEEENLLIINRLHQVLRPFVLRRLKHKVENELPEKIERLIRCEASAYQKLLMKRVEENLGSIGASKARTVHNSVMELRNICNHPYLSQLHAEEVDSLVPKHYLPTVVRLCGKLEMLDRLLPKLKAADHRVLFFSTMTRLLNVMEDYLNMKQYRYLRLDGHTSGGDRGALIDMFNQQGSPYFIFLLSIRAGGVGVNLQAADTVIIFDTDWNPQVDLQAQARAHRIGQKREVLVLRFETVQTVEEQVRAAAEHKLGVANQSITAGFFDNNTSAEDRREYLESLLRESKKEEAAPVLDDDSLNDLIARSESELDLFESVDKQRQEKEMATWKELVCGQEMDVLDPIPPPPSRLVTDDDLKEFYEAMKIYEVPRAEGVSNVGVKRKSEYLGGLDTQHYGRGKRAREVRSYEEQWTEEEFEKICQADSPESPKPKEEVTETKSPTDAGTSMAAVVKTELPAPIPLPPPPPTVEPLPLEQSKEITPPSRRGRGRPKRATLDKSPASTVPLASPGPGKVTNLTSGPDSLHGSINVKVGSETVHHTAAGITPSSQPAIILPSVTPSSELTIASPSVSIQVKGQGRKTQTGVEAPRRRGKKQGLVSPAVPGVVDPDPKLNEQTQSKPMNPSGNEAIAMSGSISDIPTAHAPDSLPGSAALKCITGTDQHSGIGIALNSQSTHPSSVSPVSQSSPPCPSIPTEIKGQSRKTQSGVGAPRRRGRKPAKASLAVPNVLAGQNLKLSTNSLDKSGDSEQSKKENNTQEMTNIVQDQACHAHDGVPGQGKESTELSDDLTQSKQITSPSTMQESAARSPGAALGQCQNIDVCEKQSVTVEVSSENSSVKTKISELARSEGKVVTCVPVSNQTVVEVIKNHSSEDSHPIVSSSNAATPDFGHPADSFPASPMEGVSKTVPNVAAKTQSPVSYSSVAPVSQSISPCPQEPMQVKRQGRKTPARVEAPRRRGRKQAPVVTAVPDGSAGQDPKSGLQSQNRSGDSLGTKTISLRSKQGTGSQELMNVIQAQACEIQSPGGLVGHDPKRKERSANAAQNKQTKLDIGAGTSDKSPLLGRIQTADVNDVARVMKEVFSGTVPSKTRVVESFGSEGRDASKLAASSKILVEMAKPEDKACSALPTMEAAAQAFVEKQSETKADAKVEDANAPVMSETLFPLKTNEGKPQSNSVAGIVEKIEDSGQLSSENLIMPSIMESICESPLSAGEKDVDHCQRAPQDDLAGFTRGATSDQVDSSLACPGEVEPPVGINDNSGNKSKSLKESPSSSPIDPIGLVCPTISTKTNDAGDNPGTSSVRTNPDDPDIVMSPGMTESGSGNKMEAFVKVPLRSSNEFNSPEGLRVSPKSDDVGDHLRVTSHILETPDHSGSEVASDVLETVSNSGKKTECAEKESSDIYNFSGSVSDKLDMAPVEAKATECSSKDVVEGMETSQRDIDLGAVPGPADTARGYNTVTSVETLSGKGQWDAQHGGSEAQEEPRLETVHSDPETTNAELGPKDHVGPLAPEMPSSVGDCVDACNMEVDPSEGLFEKDPASSTVALEVLECPEAEMSDGIDAPQVGGVLPEGNMSETTDRPLSSIVREEKEVDTSNMGPVGSSVALEDSKRSDTETDGQVNVTQICGIVPENISKDMDLPQCPVVREEKEVDTSNMGPVGSSVALEDSKRSDTETDGQVNVTQICGIVPENTSKDMDLPQCPVENIAGLSEKGPVGSIVAMQGSKSSNSEIDDQTVASQVHELVADDASEKVGLPICSSATKSENVEGSSEKSAVDSSESVNESKWSEAEEGNGIDVSQHSLLMPKSISEAVVRASSSLAKEDKKIEDLLDKGPVTSSVPQEETKGSEVEMGDQMDALQTGLIAPENTVSEHMDLPSSSLGTEEKETQVFLEKGPVSSLAPLEESICSEAEMGDRINVSQVGGILPLENKSENIDMPSSSIVIEKRIEDSDVGPASSSVAVEESKGYKAEMDDGTTVSQACGSVPGNASENMDLPQCSSATEGENIKGLSEKGPVGSVVAVEESNGQTNGSHDCGVVQEENISEDIYMPSSSIGKEEEKVEDSSVCEENLSEDIHMPSSSIGTEEQKIEDSSVREENLSEDIHMLSSSIGTEEQKIENSSMPEEIISVDIHMPSSSIGTEEQKIEDSFVPEEISSEDIHMPSSSIGTKEQNIEDSSMCEENLSEDVHMPLSSIGTEEQKIEDSSLPEEIFSEDIPMPSSSIGIEEQKIEDSVREENLSEDIHMSSSSIGTEEQKIEDSSVLEENLSEGIHMPSSSIGTEEQKIEDSSVPEEDFSEDIHIPLSSIGTEEQKIEDSVREENLSKDIHMPLSSIGIEEQRIEDSSVREENLSKDIHVPSSSIGIEEQRIEDSSVREENLSEDIHVPSSSIGIEEQRIEDSSVREENLSVHVPSSSIGIEEQRIEDSSVREENLSVHVPSSSIGIEEQRIEDSSVREENLSKDIHMNSSSIVTEEEKVEYSSNISPVASSVAPEEPEGSEAQVCVTVPENVSETLELPECPSVTEGENIEGLSEKGSIGSVVAVAPEESNGSKPEISDQMDASENKGMPVCSSATESENVEDSSEKGLLASPEAVDESKESQAEGV